MPETSATATATTSTTALPAAIAAIERDVDWGAAPIGLSGERFDAWVDRVSAMPPADADAATEALVALGLKLMSLAAGRDVRELVGQLLALTAFVALGDAPARGLPEAAQRRLEQAQRALGVERASTAGLSAAVTPSVEGRRTPLALQLERKSKEPARAEGGAGGAGGGGGGGDDEDGGHR